MNKVVVLDRDGVINVDLMTYVTKKEDFEIIEGSLEAIIRLNKSGFKVAIATNQACIGKEIISHKELEEIHQHLLDLLKRQGGTIDYIAYCPHDYSEETCLCRKPETGLLKEIENHFQTSLVGAYFVGDKESDIQAALNHNSIPLLVKTGYGEKALTAKNCPPVERCFNNLLEASSFIISAGVS